MELIRGLGGLRVRHHGCVATIGNYDGVHLGHRQVLADLVRRAQRDGLASMVVVFEPTPQEFLAPASAPARLMTFREKFTALAACGIERVLCLRFDAALAGMPAEMFIERVLVHGLGVHYLAVGDDFRFGHGRRGNFAMLEAAGVKSGFEVAASPACLSAGERVSSTRIRECLASGDMPLAARLLGAPYRMSGRVIYGDQLGHTFGFPTANIALKRRVSPVDGIFVASVHGVDDTARYGVAYVGRRPALHGRDARLEVFVFDFDGRLYGRRLQVEFLHRLRKDRAFADLAALKAQMARDVAAAQDWLKQHVAASTPATDD